jgi:replicative DNA helicase
MAQSVGLNLLAVLLSEGRTSDFYTLKREYFVKEEVSVYDWINTHVEQHGLLPTLRFTKKRTSLRDPDSGDPYGVWQQEYINRAIYNRFNSLLPSVTKLLSEKKSSEALDAVLAFAENAQSIRTNGQQDISGIATLGEEVLEEFRRLRDKDGLTGVPTGYPSLDAATQGYQNGTLIVLAARPGIGKTTFAIRAMLKAHEAGKIPLFISMEMKRQQIGARLLAMASKVNLKVIRKGHLTTIAEEMLIRKTQELARMQPLYLLEGQFRKTINDIKALVQTLSPDILIVDGAYLLKLPNAPTNMPLWQRIGEVAERLNNIALTANIPVLATFQINREGGKVAKSGRRELGVEYLMLADAIGQLAHLVIAMLANENSEDPDADKQRILKTLKGREGEDAEILMNWNYERMLFNEVVDPYALETVEDGQPS